MADNNGNNPNTGKTLKNNDNNTPVATTTNPTNATTMCRMTIRAAFKATKKNKNLICEIMEHSKGLLSTLFALNRQVTLRTNDDSSGIDNLSAWPTTIPEWEAYFEVESNSRSVDIIFTITSEYGFPALKKEGHLFNYIRQTASTSPPTTTAKQNRCY